MGDPGCHLFLGLALVCIAAATVSPCFHHHHHHLSLTMCLPRSVAPLVHTHRVVAHAELVSASAKEREGVEERVGGLSLEQQQQQQQGAGGK